MKRSPTRCAAPRGFTLIEVMITVAIVAILAAVAYPGYRDYIVRSRLVNATNGMTALRAEMERHFQDNRTYNTVGTFIAPCLAAAPLAPRTFGDAPDTFVITCTIAEDTTTTQPRYTLTATGNGAMAGFGYTVTNQDVRATTTTAAARPGWGPGTGCWIVKRGQVCPT